MPEVTIGHNSRFEIATSESPTFVDVAEVTSISGPSIARDAIDATHNRSTDGWREFIGGLKDGGEVSFEFQFDPGSTTSRLLLNQFESNAANDYRLVFPDGSMFVFDALMTGCELDDPIDDKMTGSATFKVTGKPILLQA